MSAAEQRLPQALAAFGLEGPGISVSRCGTGHINDTFLAEGPGFRRLVQRLNLTVFPHPDEVMANVTSVTHWLRRSIRQSGGDPERETLRFLPTVDGKPYFTDADGAAWRVYVYHDHSLSMETIDSPETFAEAGRAFGRFQRMLDGYPADTLAETIPHFHDTERRLSALFDAVRRDPLGRAQEVGEEIRFAAAREHDCGEALRAWREGRLPLRVTHNDTKLSNVLFDSETCRAVCVIDLDTVMPGFSIFDFGDAIRSGANHCEEDERDLSKVSFDLELYRACAAGFLEGSGGSLTAEEIAFLPLGAKLMTLECGIRFLTDYLEGDTYFRIQRPSQNLDRCRTQFKLVSDMEKNWEQMQLS